MIDTERLQGLFPDLIRAIGEDPEREGLRDTPRRIAEMYAEIFSGIGKDPRDVLRVGFEEGYDEMVVLRDIPFTSMCEHHFLPFTGKAHVSYLPRGRVVGLSKLARAVEIVARRPQLQERLTSQIADAIQEALDPLGVGVVVIAEHLCLAMRGIKKPGSTMVTSALRGVFKSDARTRAEFLAFVRER